MAHPSRAERTPSTTSGATVRADEDTPMRRLGAAWRRLWADERPGVAIARDVAVVAVVLGVLLSVLWAYTGQSFPSTSPLVVIESGSMMHPDAPYGHVGTIDPGDLVLVKDVARPSEIKTAYGAGERIGYGGRGDVIVYRPYGDAAATPIIHRAMTWVDVREVGDGEYRYTYHNEKGEKVIDAPSVPFPGMGLSERFRPTASGFITRGDNPETNQFADQVAHVPGQLIQMEWIVGKARGEVPWLGLVKLAMTGNPVPQLSQMEGQCKVLKAWAPCDEWVMLGASLAALIVVPLALDRAAQHIPAFRRWFE